jgi:hypothetical protein
MNLSISRRLLWVIPVYGVIFIGIYVVPNAWVALFGFHLAISIPLLPKLRTLPARIFHPVSPALLLLMAFAGLLGGLVLWFLWPYTGITPIYQARLASLGMARGFPWGVFIIYFSLVNPWLEEAFWRDLLTNDSRFPTLVDFLYAGFHLIILALFVSPFWLLVALLILAATGWFWRFITRLTGSLLPAIIFHIAADFSIVWVIYQMSL